MFSDRLPPSLAPTILAREVAARRGSGRLLDLTRTNPTTVGIAYPETLAAAWSNDANLRYDPHPRGMTTARETVAAWYATNGEDVSPDALVLTASTSEAYAHLFKLLCNPGDQVLVPCPSYPLFEHLAQLDGVAVGRYAFRDAGRWMLDVTHLEAQVTNRTRALIIVSPNNPTGHVPDVEEWLAMADVCRRHDLALIVDEVFAPYPLAPQPEAPWEALRDILVFRLNGLSKLIGLPQAKLGWILASGPHAVLARALDALEMIADTYLSVSTPVQAALPALLSAGASVRAQIQARLKANVAATAACVAGTSIDLRSPQGGWSVVLRVPNASGPDALAMTLLGHDLVVHPGYYYDMPHDGYLVLSLIVPEPELRAGLDVLVSLPIA